MTPRSAGWRGPILRDFSKASAEAGRLTVVSDPDGLLMEPGVVEYLAEEGFQLLALDDAVAFRFAFESQFRQQWDRGETGHLVVVVRGDRNALNRVPHDILNEARAAGRVFSFGLVDIFPGLEPNAVGEIDRQYFDVLFEAVEKAGHGSLGSNATRDFILRNVFEVAPELIRKPADLLRVLLRRHYRMEEVPEDLDRRMIEVLSQDPDWAAWPLERIVPRRDAFLNFLAERWPHFLMAQGLPVVPGREPVNPGLPGPVLLPFEHDDVRVYLHRYFAEGLLEPTPAVRLVEGEPWFAIGIAGTAAASPASRYSDLLEKLSETVPSSENATPLEWQEYSLRWGTWVRLRWKVFPPGSSREEHDRADELASRVQAAFSTWLVRRYGSLPTLPYLPRPVLGHHVPHYLAHHLGEPGSERIALLVIDGMAIDQWRILEESLDGFHTEEFAIFSWIPTLTQIGRQAIFSGRIPLEFATSIEGTHREAQHWSNFWQDHNLRESQVRYVKPQGRNQSFAPLSEMILDAASIASVKVLGAVISLIDQNMHQVGLGTPGLHALVEAWSRAGELSRLVGELVKRGYTVFITADHGNVFGRGFGKPNVGETAQQRGERAHIFRNRSFRDQTAARFPQAVEWPQVGLPKDYFALLAPFGSCFLPEGKESVSHGGISLEEVVVPFVRISEAP